MIKPYIWQQPAVEKTIDLLSNQQSKIIINTSETGTGKTIVSLEAVKHLGRRVFVIAPKSVHTAWRRTADAMGVMGLLDVINAEKLNYRNKYYVHKVWNLPEDVVVIWDEVHKGASGRDSKITEALARLALIPNQVILLSATIADNPLKMRGIGYLAGLHQWKPTSFFPWCRKNGCFKADVGGRTVLLFPKGTAGIRHMQALHQELKDITVQTKISEIPDFPDTLIQANLYDLSAEYTDEINTIYQELDEKFKTETDPNLALLRARQKTELLKVPLLSDLAKEAVDENKSAVLFVNFRETAHRLKEELSAYCPTGIIIGMQSPTDRDINISRFQDNETTAMVCTTAAGGLGISLHDIHHVRNRVSFLTPGYNASEFKQALGRINRTGGTKTIQTIVLAANTVEERVHRTLQTKLKNIAALQNGDLDEFGN